MGNKAYLLEGDEVFCQVIKRELEDKKFEVCVCNQFADIQSCQSVSDESLAVINLSLFDKNINEKIEIVEKYFGLRLILIADHPELDITVEINNNAIFLSKPVNMQSGFARAIRELFPKKQL